MRATQIVPPPVKSKVTVEMTDREAEMLKTLISNTTYGDIYRTITNHWRNKTGVPPTVSESDDFTRDLSRALDNPIRLT